ncbi:MAG TPA: PAS domain-containing protein [Candidatus Binatus sp.]
MGELFLKMGIGGHRKRVSELLMTNAKILPSAQQLELFGTNGMLALIHDAIGHLITPVHSLPAVLPALMQIVSSLVDQQTVLKEMLSIQKDAVLVRFVANRLEGMPSLSHSVLDRDLRFVSVNKSYQRLFEFSPAQFHKRPLNELVHSEDIPRFNKVIRLLLSGGGHACELIEWRATGSGRFVLTKDSFWGIGSNRVRGPEYISTVSERLTDEDEASTLVEGAIFRTRDGFRKQGTTCRRPTLVAPLGKQDDSESNT